MQASISESSYDGEQSINSSKSVLSLYRSGLRDISIAVRSRSSATSFSSPVRTVDTELNRQFPSLVDSAGVPTLDNFDFVKMTCACRSTSTNSAGIGLFP